MRPKREWVGNEVGGPSKEIESKISVDGEVDGT